MRLWTVGIEHSRQAIELDPESVAAMFTRGGALTVTALRELGRGGDPRPTLEEAVEYFDAAERLLEASKEELDIDDYLDYVHDLDITKYLDLTKVKRPGHEQKRVNVDFPVWMIESLDREASRLGVPRQSLIKMLIARHFDKAS